MQLAVGGVAVIAMIAIILSVTLTTDIRRNNSRIGNLRKYKSNGGEPITFDEFLGGKFRSKSFNGTWWTGNEIQWRDKEDNLVLWNVETNQTTVLVASDSVGLVSSTASFVSFAPGDKSLLLFIDNREVYCFCGP